jgi:hypothetical protein
MAPPKKKRSSLSKSAKYYRDNPTARSKKASTDKKINARPEQKKKRTEAGAARSKAKKAGKNVSGKDYDHGSKRFISSSANRGKKGGTKGDRNARARKK